MEHSYRKSVRLPGYDYSQNGAYFITICTKDKQPILGAVSVGADAHIGPSVALSSTGKTVEKFLRRIPGLDKYVIMPNHIHMIIIIDHDKIGPMWASAPTQDISQRVKSFKILVSKELGASVFQRSYYDHVIRDEADYQTKWNYIDTNPLRWTLDKYYTE